MADYYPNYSLPFRLGDTADLIWCQERKRSTTKWEEVGVGRNDDGSPCNLNFAKFKMAVGNIPSKLREKTFFLAYNAAKQGQDATPFRPTVSDSTSESESSDSF